MSYLWYWPAGGWDFETWKARHPWQPVVSEQSGDPALRPPVRRGVRLEEWERERARWREITAALLGSVSDTAPDSMRWEILEHHTEPTYSRQRLRYMLTDAEWGYAWLLVPTEAGVRREDVRREQGQLSPPSSFILHPSSLSPAVIALHQTVPQGKDEPVGLEGDPELAYGRDLAERGFVVLAPDAIGFGERRKDHPHALYHSADQFFAAHPEGSVMAKMAFDTSRAVDLLQRLPGVDGARIGCIGHSHGAYGTLFAMLHDERIRAGIMSCGFTTLRTDPTPERWWHRTAIVPRLGFYERRIEQTPLDVHHWLALVAPRPLMVVGALADAIFPDTRRLPRLLTMVKSVYRLCGAPTHLRPWIFNGSHRFPRAARTRAYRMLQDALG